MLNPAQRKVHPSAHLLLIELWIDQWCQIYNLAKYIKNLTNIYTFWMSNFNSGNLSSGNKSNFQKPYAFAISGTLFFIIIKNCKPPKHSATNNFSEIKL
jgi:hypothetical protein